MATAAHTYHKSARLGTRCTAEQKVKIQRAAELSGNSMTDFTINTLMEKADTIIKNHYILELSMRDQTLFAETLLNAPTPNSALLNAKKHHQDLI